VARAKEWTESENRKPRKGAKGRKRAKGLLNAECEVRSADYHAGFRFTSITSPGHTAGSGARDFLIRV
jgi:hypothetical protein